MGIVKALDVFEQGESGGGLCGKSPAIKQFAFQAGEEALFTGRCRSSRQPNPWTV